MVPDDLYKHTSCVTDFSFRIVFNRADQWLLHKKIIKPKAPVITQMHVDAEVITANELRASANLEAWEGPEGQRIVKPAAEPGGGFFSQDEGQEVGKPAAPFARIPAARRQLPLPLTSTPRTSPTSSDSQTRTSAVPFPPSGGPARPR